MIIKAKNITLKIENGKIVQIGNDLVQNTSDVCDLSQYTIISGLIDMHCHLREPGFEYKEDINSGIASALNGGIVGICPMANTNPVNDNIFILNKMIEKADKKIGFFPICAVTNSLYGDNLTDFKKLKESGAIAFSDDGKPILNKELFKNALKTGELIISHCEDETNEVKWQLEALKEVGGKLHFAHISKKASVDLIREAKKEGIKVTCETAPHYFTFNTDDLSKDVFKNGVYKMNPPLGTKEDMEAVIEGLLDGTIDVIATDHAPHSIDEKLKDYNFSPNGIVGFETVVGATLSRFNVDFLVQKMAINPAKILELNDFNDLKTGSFANLTIIDENKKWKVDQTKFKSKCKISPFNRIEFKGKAVGTIINGKLNMIEDEEIQQ